MNTTTTDAWPRAGLMRLCHFAELIAIAMLVAIATLTVAQVFARNLFDLGLAAAEEAARFCGVGLVFLAAPILLARGAHVRVDMFEAMFPPRLRRRIRIANELCAAAFCGLFLYGGWVFMQRASRFSTPVLGIPNIVYYAPALLGVALLLAVALVRSYDVMTEPMEAASEPRS